MAYRPLAGRVGAVAITAGLLLPGGAAAQGSAASLTDSANKLVNEGSYQQAIDALERAIQVDDSYGPAYHSLGFAYGRLGDHGRAADAFLRATQLRPGWAEAHRMAALAAANSGRLDLAWEQAIRAQQSGREMSTEIEVLTEMGPPPENLADLLVAPRVFLEPIDLSAFEGFNENPFGRETRTGNSSIGAATGQPASEGSRNLTSTQSPDPAALSGWATQTGAPMVAESRADLDLMNLQLARGLSESLEIALVTEREQAGYVVVVEVENVARGTTDELGGQTVSNEPRWLQGSIVIRTGDGNREVLRRPLRLTDIATASTLRGEFAVYLRQLAIWARQQR